MRFRPVISALLLAAYLPACTSFQATSQPLAELTAPPKPVKSVRVTTIDNRSLELEHPRVAGDTLYGTSLTFGARGEPTSEAVAIPVAQVQTVEVRKPDSGKSTALGIGIVAVGVGLAVVSANAMNHMFDGMTLSGWE
jgi:hypothetical protein